MKTNKCECPVFKVVLRVVKGRFSCVLLQAEANRIVVASRHGPLGKAEG